MRFAKISTAVIATIAATQTFAAGYGVTRSVAMDPDAAAAIDVEYHDLNADGEMDALVRMDQACDGESKAPCRWKVFLGGEGHEALASGSAYLAFIEPTVPEGGVVSLDGVTYAATPNGLVMYGDFFAQLPTSEVTAEDYELVASATSYNETHLLSLEKRQVDLFGDGRPETIYSVLGSYYQVGVWGTPFVIFDAANQLVLSEVTSDNPQLFQSPQMEGVRIVITSPSQQKIISLE